MWLDILLGAFSVFINNFNATISLTSALCLPHYLVYASSLKGQWKLVSVFPWIMSSLFDLLLNVPCSKWSPITSWGWFFHLCCYKLWCSMSIRRLKHYNPWSLCSALMSGKFFLVATNSKEMDMPCLLFHGWNIYLIYGTMKHVLV